MVSTVQRVLLGRDSFVLVAGPVGGLLIGGLVVVVSPSVARHYTVAPEVPLEWAILLGLLAIPAVLAWVNDGLLTCWAVEFGPFVAILLLGSDATIQTSPSAIYDALVVATVLSVAWGSLGFVVGITSRWTVQSLWNWWLRRSTAGRRSA